MERDLAECFSQTTNQINKNSPKKASRPDTKLTLAKWFCERILRYKTNSPTLIPEVKKKIEEDSICEQSISFENWETPEDENNLNNIIIDCLNDSRLSIGLVGDNSANLMNSILFHTTSKMYTKELENPLKAQGPEQCVLNLSMDEKFKVNWTIEEKNNESFLLSEEVESKNINNGVNTMNSSGSIHSSTFTFQYGEVPELIVGFKKESDFLHPGYVLGNIKPLLGKQIRFCGLGKNIQVDRIYIRERLKEIRTKYEAYTDSFLIRMPSSFLKGNKELIFYDGLRGSQIEQAQRFQYGINCLTCIVDERGISHNLRSFIISSGFLHKLYRNPKEFNIIFLVNNRNNFTLQPPASTQLQLLIRNQFLDILKENVPSPYTSIIGKLASHLKVIFIDTKLSSTLGQVDEEQLRKTGIPILISTINNISIGKCADSIRFISDDWISKNKNSNEFNLFQASTFTSSSQSRSKVEIPSALKNQFELFKKELAGKVKSIDRCLIQQAHEAFKSASSQLHSHSNTSSDNSDLMNLESNDVDNLICGSLMHSAPAYWKKEVLEILPKQMERIVYISSTLLKECVKTLDFPKDPSTLEKVRLKRLMEFCDLLHRRTANRVKEISQSLFANDPDEVVREACENAIKLNQFNAQRNVEENVKESLKKISIEAAYNIKKQFSKILGSSIAQLSDIEKDIYHSANLVMITLQTDPNTLKSPVETPVQSPSSAPTTPINTISKLTSPSLNQANFSYNSNTPSPILSLRSPNTIDLTSSSDDSVQLFKRNQNEIEPWARVTGKCTIFPSDVNLKLFDYSRWSLLSFLENLTEDRDRFHQQLRSIGLKIKPPFDPVDGNSQFKALANQAYGTETVYPIVRLLVIAEILANFHDYEKFVKNTMDIQEYIYRMSKDGECGDYITLTAFANYYEVDLLIYSPVLQHPLLIKSRNRNASKVYCISYMSGNSYFSLVNNSLEMSRKRKREESTSHFPNNSAHKRTRINSHSSPNYLVPLDKNKIHVDSHFNSNFVVPEENMDIETLENKFSSISLQPKTLVSNSSLSSLCISTIVNNLTKFRSIDSLPENLIQKMLTQMVSNRMITIVNLNKLLVGSKLTSLDLSYCKQLSYPICRTLSNYTSGLKRLNLSHTVNLSCDSLLAILRNAKDIEIIDIRGCYKIDDQFINFITSNCANLKYLNLQGCIKITDQSISQFLQSNKQLKVLVLRDCNQITDRAFAHSNQDLKLRDVDLTDCSLITDASIQSITADNPHLYSIKLTGKGITNKAIEMIAQRCPKLQTLELNDCSITDQSISLLAFYCTKLSTLKISLCRQISIDLFRQIDNNERKNTIVNFPSLKSIDLTRSSNIMDRTIEDFVLAINQKSLEEINFSSCEDLSDRSIMKLVKTAGSSIKSINLSKCPKITDDAIAQIAKYCPQLEKLSLYNCPLISDHSIVNLAKLCGEIKYLDLSSCEQITDSGFKCLATLKQLENLFIEESNISDDTFLSIIKENNNIQTLKLAYCKGISDQTIESIANYCYQLKVLDLSYCSNLSISSIRSALHKLNELKELNLRGFNSLTIEGIEHSNLISLNLSWCKNMEDAAVAHIAKGCPSLVDLDLAWCGKISKYSVCQLAKECSALRTLNLNGCTNVPFLVSRYLSNPNLITYI